MKPGLQRLPRAKQEHTVPQKVLQVQRGLPRAQLTPLLQLVVQLKLTVRQLLDIMELVAVLPSAQQEVTVLPGLQNLPYAQQT